MVLVVAVLLLALPLTMLVVRWVEQGTRPQTELGASWQMYSAVPSPTYTGTDASGRTGPLDVDPLPPVLRDVDTGAVVPDLLCHRHPELVLVRRDGGTQPGAFRC